MCLRENLISSRTTSLLKFIEMIVAWLKKIDCHNLDSDSHIAYVCISDVRTTRSGRKVQSTSVPAVQKASGRKTRKKIVVMEVEVSDEEEEVSLFEK